MTKGRKIESIILRVLIYAAAAVTFAVLLFLLAYILINGVPNLKPSLFSLEYNTENASLMPALINTVIMTLLSLVIAIPFGIFSAIFLVEYAKKGNRFVGIIRLTTETLQGIPSFSVCCFRYGSRMGIFHPGRCIYHVYHDPASDYENDRRSIKSST